MEPTARVSVAQTATPSRIVENTKVFDFELSDEDVRMIAGLEGVCGYSSDPDTTTS